MARGRHLLTTRFVSSVKEPGRYADGDGLYLLVRKRSDTTERTWIFRYRRGARGSSVERSLGLGPARDVSLSDARRRASEIRSAIADGRDPKRSACVPTFGEAADELVAALQPGFKNTKHAAQWSSTLSDTYCANLRRIPVNEVTTDHILAVLKPLWLEVPETASRIRGRIERVLDAAKAKHHREGDNPARWRGHLALLLPKQSKLTRGHHRALPWRDAPAFMERLRRLESVSAIALEWTILTATRTTEAIKSRHDEIRGDVWCIPATRMKAGREHRVPLTTRTLEIATEMQELGGDWLFPGPDLKKPLSQHAMAECLKGLSVDATVHGFRSTFRDWVSEATSFEGELAEQALAHTIENKTERAYRRGDKLERRRDLMDAWERYLNGTTSALRLVG